MDHQVHPEFKTEWWYFTGTLRAETGKEYGYELTFFRQGVVSPALQKSRSDLSPDARSEFVQSDFKFAHFAITDLTGRRFYFAQKIDRGTYGGAGFGHPFDTTDVSPAMPLERLAWLDQWALQPQPDGSWRITASTQQPTSMSLDLTVSPRKPLVIEGVDGVSQKAAGDGNASYYYSYPRMKTSGVLSVDKEATQHVTGESWFDHEWASDQLAPDQVGWNWFCFQFDDQTEVMLYAMRRRDGSVDPVSSGTWIAADGSVEYLKSSDFTLRALRSWRSLQTSASYPVAWQVGIPSHHATFVTTPRMDDQELVLPPISYWEGSISADGKRGDEAIKGHGYMELTGYAGALTGLQQR